MLSWERLISRGFQRDRATDPAASARRTCQRNVHYRGGASERRSRDFRCASVLEVEDPRDAGQDQPLALATVEFAAGLATGSAVDVQEGTGLYSVHGTFLAR